jgi:uncharacterized protein
MKKIITAASLVFYFHLSFAQTFLFEVKSPTSSKTSYLFGTMHETNPKVFNFNDSLFWAIRQSEKAIFELDLSRESIRSFSPELDKPEFEKMFYQFMNGFAKGIAQNLIPRMVKEVSPEEMVDKIIQMLPQFVSSVNDLTEQFSGSSKTQFMDLFLQNYARSQQIEIIGIETMSEQLVALFNDALSYDPELAAKELTEEVLKFMKNQTPMPNLASFMQSQKKFIDLYADKDYNGVCDTVTRLGQHSHTLMRKFYKSVFVDRNDVMLERMLPFIEENSVFIAVGAGHLCGDNGLVQAFSNKGYLVRPVNTSVPSASKRLWDKHTGSNESFKVHLPADIVSNVSPTQFTFTEDFEVETTEAYEDEDDDIELWNLELEDMLNESLLSQSYLFTNKGLISFSVRSYLYDPRDGFQPEYDWDSDWDSDWGFESEADSDWDIESPVEIEDDEDMDFDLEDVDFDFDDELDLWDVVKPPSEETIVDHMPPPPPPPPVPTPPYALDEDYTKESPRLMFTKIIEEAITKTEVSEYIKKVQEIAKEKVEKSMEETGENPLDFSMGRTNPYRFFGPDATEDSVFTRKHKVGKKHKEVQLELVKNPGYEEFSYTLSSVFHSKNGTFHQISISGDKHVILSEEFNEFFFSFEAAKTKKSKKSKKDPKNTTSKKNNKKSKK